MFKFYRFEEVCEVFFDGLRVNLDNVVLKEGMEDVKFYFIGKWLYKKCNIVLKYNLF